MLLKSCYFLHALFSFLCPEVALQRICAQCVYQCGLFTVLLCRLTGATLRQFHCNPNSEAWTAFTERNLYSSALLHPEGQLVLSSRCYTALCTNVDYSETAMKTEWSHRKPACKTEVMHTIVQLSVQWNKLTVYSWMKHWDQKSFLCSSETHSSRRWRLSWCSLLHSERTEMIYWTTFKIL